MKNQAVIAIRKEINELAETIIKMKSERGPANNGFIPGLINTVYLARHLNIAWGELRGRTRDQIEKPAKDNLPNEEYVSKLKTKWEAELRKYAPVKKEEKVEEAVHIAAA